MEKKYKVMILILVIYIAFATTIFWLYQSKTEKYIVLSSSEVFQLKDDIISPIAVGKIHKFKKLHVLQDGKKIGTYKVNITNSVNILNAKAPISELSTHDLVGVTYSVQPSNFKREISDESDLQEINQFLTSQNISGYETLTMNEKITFDLDSDGQKEVLYTVSNLFFEEEYDQVFSFIYMIHNGERKILYKNIGQTSNSLDMCSSFINNIIDLDKDHKLEIIMGCSYFDNLGTDYDFLKYEENQFVSMLK